MAICTRLGTPVLSRNFVKISHARLETLLSSFIRSLSLNQQHSYFENDQVRFVFLPLGQLYLVLITSKKSNMIQDIECLHLAGRLISSLCDSYEETAISNKHIEIIFAIDEIILNGTCEYLTLPQINSNLLMESREEELQELIEKVRNGNI